jgi:hypothetical protein
VAREAEHERSDAGEQEEAVMTTLRAEEKDVEQRADGSLTRARLANERGNPDRCGEPIEHGLDPGPEPRTAPVVTGRRGRQIDYL